MARGGCLNSRLSKESGVGNGLPRWMGGGGTRGDRGRGLCVEALWE